EVVGRNRRLGIHDLTSIRFCPAGYMSSGCLFFQKGRNLRALSKLQSSFLSGSLEKHWRDDAFQEKFSAKRRSHRAACAKGEQGKVSIFIDHVRHRGNY